MFSWGMITWLQLFISHILISKIFGSDIVAHIGVLIFGLWKGQAKLGDKEDYIDKKLKDLEGKVLKRIEESEIVK